MDPCHCPVAPGMGPGVRATPAPRTLGPSGGTLWSRGCGRRCRDHHCPAWPQPRLPEPQTPEGSPVRRWPWDCVSLEITDGGSHPFCPFFMGQLEPSKRRSSLIYCLKIMEHRSLRSGCRFSRPPLMHQLKTGRNADGETEMDRGGETETEEEGT